MRRVRVVPGDGVIGQPPQQGNVTGGRRVLEGADPQVAARDAGEHGARQWRLAVYGAPRCHHRQRPGGRDAHRVHRFADDVLAQHRADRGEAVAAPGERRSPRALEVEVAKTAAGRREFAQQQRPAVAQAGNVAAELVSGVCLGHRRRPIGDLVADEQSPPVRPAQPRGVQAEFGGQRLVEDEQTRVGGGVGLPPDGQLGQLARKVVVQGDGRIGCNAHATQTTEDPQVGSVW